MEVNVKLEIQEDTPLLELDLDSKQPLALTTSTVTQKKATTDYKELINKPSIENIELIDNNNMPNFGVFIDYNADYITNFPSSDKYALETLDIDTLWNLAFV